MFKHTRWDSWKEPLILGIVFAIIILYLLYISCSGNLSRPMTYEGEYTLKYKSQQGYWYTFVSEDGKYEFKKFYIDEYFVPEFLPVDVFVNQNGSQYFDVHLGKSVTQFKIKLTIINFIYGIPFLGIPTLLFGISYWMYKMGFGVDD